MRVPVTLDQPQTRTHNWSHKCCIYSNKKQMDQHLRTYEKHTHVHPQRHKSQMFKEISASIFMQTRRQKCSQMETVSHRWKVTAFLSLFLFPSLSSSSCSFLDPLPLFLFALGILVIAAALSASDSISSLCFIVLHFFHFSFLIWSLSFFLSSLLYSERGNWNSFLQSICCHTNACTNTMLCSSFVFPQFLLLFHPCTQQTYNTHPSPLCTTLTHVQSAGCVTPSALWVWMHAFVCMCVCICATWACMQRWHCKVKRTEAVLVHNKTWSMAAL